MSFIRELVPPPGHVRTLCASNLAKTVGHGIFVSVGVLFFTRTVGIPAGQVGLALTIGAAVGMFASVPAGRLADLTGPRNTTVGFLLLLGVFVCAYGFVGSFPALVVAASLALLAESATDAARGALIAGLIPSEERVRAWAYLRSTANIGLSLGAGAGAVGLVFDTRLAYVGLLMGAGAMFLTAGFAYLRVPQVPPAPKVEDGPTWVVLRDLPYATMALLNTVLIMNWPVVTVALPVWIADRTEAPVWVFSAVLMINTAMVVFLQVRMSRGAGTVDGGARAMRRSGVLLAVSCALFAVTAGLPAWAAGLLLLAAGVVHVFGEMLHGAGSWSLGYGLAPEHAMGQYQGLFTMSIQLGTVATPVLATALIVGLGWSGWLVFALLFLVAGAAAPPVARWARQTRRPDAATRSPSA
ncbi:MFS transporter [Allosalinactinospora lopnorensis]|uniref:MFS transporter n=1 Tax=Allosalinactinospora lopnorensis TaxID=1352348 RepID=UPI000623E4C1|nr:MFS transporter [Allosalinactinospora lopnorensis]